MTSRSWIRAAVVPPKRHSVTSTFNILTSHLPDSQDRMSQMQLPCSIRSAAAVLANHLRAQCTFCVAVLIEALMDLAISHPAGPVDAAQVPRYRAGSRTIFTACHHFYLDQARAVLVDAGATGEWPNVDSA